MIDVMFAGGAVCLWCDESDQLWQLRRVATHCQQSVCYDQKTSLVSGCQQRSVKTLFFQHE